MKGSFRRMSFGLRVADTRMGSGRQVVLQKPEGLRRRFRCLAPYARWQPKSITVSAHYNRASLAVVHFSATDAGRAIR